MIPGVTYLPEASMTVASSGARTSVPTAAILPSRTSTEAPSSVPCVTVITVAFRISRVGAGASQSTIALMGPDAGATVVAPASVSAGSWAAGASGAAASAGAAATAPSGPDSRVASNSAENRPNDTLPSSASASAAPLYVASTDRPPMVMLTVKLKRSPLTQPSVTLPSPRRPCRRPDRDPSGSIFNSAVDSCAPRGDCTVIVQVPLMSTAGASSGLSASRFSYFRPSTKTTFTSLSSSSRSPSVTMRLAILPRWTLPSRSATP